MTADFLFDRPRKPAGLFGKSFSIALLLAGYSALCWMAFSESLRNWEKVWGYRETFWNGWLTTVQISAAALVLSSLIGGATALARRSNFLPLRYTAIAYVETGDAAIRPKASLSITDRLRLTVAAADTSAQRSSVAGWAT
jgi:hypothetical protein